MKFAIVCTGIVLALSTSVGGAILYTPTLWAVAPDAFACNLTNVSPDTRPVRIRIISDGDILLDSGLLQLEPRHTTDHTVEGFAEGGPLYCEFVVEGSARDYRGAAKLFHAPNSSDFVAVAAE